MLIDSHCHLNYKGLVEQEADVLTRARAAGVSAMLNISTRENEWNAVIGLAEREEDVWASVGIHPHEADHHGDVTADKLIKRASHSKVIGIGETGLDYYYDYSDREQQKTCFRQHIIAARETGLPIIIHTRDAEEDTADILAEEMGKGRFNRGHPLFYRECRFRPQGARPWPVYLAVGDRLPSKVPAIFRM